MLAAAALGQRGTAKALAAAAAYRCRRGGELRAAAGEGWLLVLGNEAELPWADGVTYLGWDGGLLLPTTQTVQPHPDLLRQILSASLDVDAATLVVVPGSVVSFSVTRGAADPAWLEAYAGGVD